MASWPIQFQAAVIHGLSDASSTLGYLNEKHEPFCGYIFIGYVGEPCVLSWFNNPGDLSLDVPIVLQYLGIK